MSDIVYWLGKKACDLVPNYSCMTAGDVRIAGAMTLFVPFIAVLAIWLFRR